MYLKEILIARSLIQMKYRENNSGLQILEIEVTRRCNLNCKHCYVGGNQNDKLEKNIIKDIINQANDMKINRLVITGGEPLIIADDVFEYANYAKKLGIPDIALLTNGTLVNTEIAKRCKVFSGIQMSLEGTPKNKGELRIDYFEKLEQAINLFHQEKIPITLYITLHKNNISIVPNMIEYALVQKCKVAFNCLIPTDNKLKQLVLSPCELKKVFTYIVNKVKLNENIRLSHHFRFLVEDDRMKDILNHKYDEGIQGGCLAGIAAGYITAEGDFYACPFIRISCGNIKQQKLSDLWENSDILNILRNRKKFKGKCGKCSFVNFCGGCRAMSLYKYGQLNNSDDNCILGV